MQTDALAAGDQARPAPRGRPIIIIGAGPGGICMGIKLLQAGHSNFLILEQAAGVGGTWWHNRYPGAACDVPSHLYSFSFEIKRDWSCPYATAPEILAYMEMCVEKYGLAPHIRLRTAVTRAVWDEAESQWTVETDTGERHQPAVLVAAQGMFNEPTWPNIPGLDDFRGTLFHTARWNHEHDLNGERVGIIGSAASAVQCVPEVAQVAGQLTLFQRTPNWILPKREEPYRPDRLEYYKHAPDAVEQRRFKLFQDFEGFAMVMDPDKRREAEQIGRDNIAVVEDPALRRKLTPDFPFGCKRVLRSSKYYPTFNRPNVDLVTDSVTRITATGVVTADGTARDFDTLVMATGFDVTRYLSSVHVVGRGGRVLAEEWNEGARAYLGITTAGFPNLFQLYGPNTNKGSILFMIECQVAYIMRQLGRLDGENLAWMDVRPDVMATYNEAIQRDANAITVWAENCNNYFRHPVSGRVVTQYPRDMVDYREDTLRPDPEAYEVQALTGQQAQGAWQARGG